MSDYKSVIYHELGHMLGFILANREEHTVLGPIALNVGKIENSVTTKLSLYHYTEDDFDVTKTKIEENTKNIPRTVAWFIEVMLGSALQAQHDKIPFSAIFGPERNKHGNIDFCNLNAVKPLSSFNWIFDQIDGDNGIYKDVSTWLSENNVYHKLNPVVLKLNTKILKDKNQQLLIDNEEMLELYDEIESVIDKKMWDEYVEIIQKWTKIFDTE